MTDLSANDMEQGFARPYRTRVKHGFCGFVSPVRITDAVQLAVNPKSLKDCYCLLCGRRLPVAQFIWFPDGEGVGT